MSPFWSKKPTAVSPAESFTPFNIEPATQSERPVATSPTAPISRPNQVRKPNGHVAGAMSGKEWVVATDGSGDFETIDDAVIAAGPGDQIRIRTGHYFVETLDIDKPVHLLGDGDAINLSGDPATPNAVLVGSEAESIIHWTANDGSIRNILWVHHRDPDTTPVSEFRYGIDIHQGNVEIERCGFAGVMNLACQVKQQSRLTIRSCIVHGDCISGFVVAEGSSLLLEDSTIAGEGIGYAVSVSGESTSTLRGNTIGGMCFVGAGTDLVEDNVLESISISAPTCKSLFRKNQIAGMVQVSGGTPVFEDNDIGNGVGAAVWIKEDANPILRRNRLKGGMVLQDLGGGITIGNRARATIEENSFRDCQGAALICSDAASPVLKRNVFSQNQDFAAIILGGPPLFEENEFSNNTARAVIRISGATSRPVFRRNLIAFNSAAGIVAYDGANVRIEQNEITRNNGTGVVVFEGGFAEVIDNQITGNSECAVRLLNGGRGIFKRNDFTGSGEQSVGIDETSMPLVDANQIVNENRLD